MFSELVVISDNVCIFEYKLVTRNQNFNYENRT